jgi:protein-L-isoaspartate(D-aspartate) O-methyltransferase
VLNAIRNLKREDFVPEPSKGAASQDTPLPIGYGQTISQPYIVAYMTEALHLKGYERVLEIGTGSGYQTAVLAQLCQEVYTVEIVPRLACSARRLLRRLGFQNVYFHVGDGSLGWPEAAPFDAILATAAPPEVPTPLLGQLKRGGRMVLPVGPVGGSQELVRITRAREPGGVPQVESLLPVLFVPMTGEALHP